MAGEGIPADRSTTLSWLWKRFLSGLGAGIVFTVFWSFLYYQDHHTLPLPAMALLLAVMSAGYYLAQIVLHVLRRGGARKRV